MVLGSSILATPWAIFIFAIVIVGVLIVILTLVERGLSKKLVNKRMEEHSYSNRLKKISLVKTQPKKYLESLDFLSREFFTEKLRIDGNATYSSLIDMFENINDKEAAKFCSRMQEAFYSGDEITSDKLDYLTRNFSFLVEREDQKEREVHQLSKKHNLFGSAHKEKEAPVVIDAHKHGNTKIDKRIISYLDEGIRRGFPIELLRKNLLKGGFQEEMIHLAERQVKNVHHLERTSEQEKLQTATPLSVARTMPLVKNPVETEKKETPVLEKKQEPALQQKNITLLVRDHHTHPLRRSPQPEMRDISGMQNVFIQGVSQVDPQLTKIVNEAMKRGFDMKVMKQKLLDRGFEEGAIDRAIAAVQEPQTKIMAQPTQPKKRSWFARLFGKKEEIPVDQTIVRILNEASKRGFDMKVMKQKLLDRGFEEGAIDRAIAFIGEQPSAPKKKKKEIEEVDILPFHEKDIRKHLGEGDVKKKLDLPPMPTPKPKTVPYVKQEVTKTRSRAKIDKKTYDRIGSMDDFERLRNKISQRNASGWEDVGKRGSFSS